MKMAISWYQNTLGRYWKDEVVIISVNQRLIMLYFSFLEFLSFLFLYPLFTFTWLESYVFISNANWTDWIGAPPLGVPIYGVFRLLDLNILRSTKSTKINEVFSETLWMELSFESIGAQFVQVSGSLGVSKKVIIFPTFFPLFFVQS